MSETRALRKTLRDGRSLAVDIVPREGDRGFWMRASINGQVVSDEFVASVQRGASPVPGLPHVISLPFGATWKPVGLTDTEADQIEAAVREWQERSASAARDSAPDMPAREVQGFTTPPVPGTITELTDGPVMILAIAGKRWIPEDGRSFGLDAESGYLFTAMVRDLADHEASLRFRGHI